MGYKRGEHLVGGIGVNDLATPTRWTENGKSVKSPYYALWKDMLERVYTPNENDIKPYAGVTVHADWHRFSNFKRWVDHQPQTNWQHLQLDKDLLVKGNKVYAPDVCCFLTNQENSLFKPSCVPFGSVRFDERGNLRKPWQLRNTFKGESNYKQFLTQQEAKVYGARVTIQRVTDMANAHTHQFIRDAMFRWIADWQQELTVLEAAARVAQSSAGLLFEN